jgi:hypothetical protein
MGEEESIKYSAYDQKAFTQIRLHDSLNLINQLSSTPLTYNITTGNYNFEVIFNTLVDSIYPTVYSKLTDAERADFDKKVEEIQNAIDSNELFVKKKNIRTGKMVSSFNDDKWKIIRDGIRELRKKLETYLDKHKFNPSAEDIDWEDD